MFGRIKKNRAKRALKGEREGFRAEKEIFESQRPGVEDERERAIQSRALEQAKSMKEKRIADRSEGRQYAQNVLSQDYQGLTPQQRQNMESTGNRRLSREVQGHERRLLAEQGRKGIRGGTAYAQRADLARMATDAQGQYQRDLSQLDSDLALKKLAAAFNIEQGEAAQGQIDRQMAIDEQRLENERKRQRVIEDRINRTFNRI